MSEVLLLDTSVAIPLLVASHEAHEVVSSWAAGRVLGLAGHALAEAYAVLTRLPGDARVSAEDAVRLIDDNFPLRATVPPEAAFELYRELAEYGVAGGATYDGLVALAARSQEAVLVTRDARARGTYEAVGARVQVLTEPTAG